MADEVASEDAATPRNPAGVNDQSPYSNMGPQQQGDVDKEKAEQMRVARDLLPIAKTIEEFIEKEREDIQKYHSYATAIFARNGGKKATEEDIAAEFRAREIYLSMLDRLSDKLSNRAITLENKIKEQEKAKDITPKNRG